MTRAVLLCPGRGSYTDATRGRIPADHAWTRRAEELRAELGLPSLLELDGEGRFSAKVHLSPANATLLIWLRTLLDAERARRQHELVCVGGNSMGWYSALVVAGALSFEDGFRLAQTVSRLQEEHGARHGGGQLLYPLVDEDWQADPSLQESVDAALAESRPDVHLSIRLGGYVVLAGSDEGLRRLNRALPVLERGRNRFPYRLVQHGPYHTPLVAEVSQQAREALAGLAWRRPRSTLVDGRGTLHRPWSADPAELREYTLGAQLVDPYDFTASVRVALREFAPERLVLPGPGNSLGGVCGQILVAERWGGVHGRGDLEERREQGRSPLESMDA